MKKFLPMLFVSIMLALALASCNWSPTGNTTVTTPPVIGIVIATGTPDPTAPANAGQPTAIPTRPVLDPFQNPNLVQSYCPGNEGRTVHITQGQLLCPSDLVVFATQVANGQVASASGLAVGTPSACVDTGERFVHQSQVDGSPLDRSPVTDGQRSVVVEVSRAGSGFGGFDRMILIIPVGGSVWSVNILRAQTIAVTLYCGSVAEIVANAADAHRRGLQIASRATDGSEPNLEEIGVYALMTFESGQMTVIRAASQGPTATAILGWFDISWNDGGQHANVPITVANP